jgi:1,4-alpha-glucan branching enzyme
MPSSIDAPPGANLTGDGAAFRVWAPAAHSVSLILDDEQVPLERQDDGYWTGFVSGLEDGDEYMFHVNGDAGAREKRDPFARELTPKWPDSRCILRDPDRYRWRSDGFRTPSFHDFILYQLHVGAFFGPRLSHRPAKFLDVATHVDHLASLGITAVQLLPVVEFRTMFSMGYNGTDYFSPEMDYAVHDEEELASYVEQLAPLFTSRGAEALTIDECRGAYAQFKVLIDLLHLHGIAVTLDVVYNHAGGDFDPKSMYFFDLQHDDSLYFTKQGWAGGLVFAFWKREVRDLLIRNARYWLTEFRLDGLRYDEVSVIDHEGGAPGWEFCKELSTAVRETKPSALQNAEYWPVNTWIVRETSRGGAGFDATQHDGLRDTVRKAVAQASRGMEAPLDLDAIAASLELRDFAPRQAVTCVENHDVVSDKDGIGRGPRIPALADGSDHRSPWARGRSRVAVALTLTAPGIPMLFMGQEILENERWSDDREPWNLISWEWLEQDDPVAAGFLRFTREAVALRRRFEALRRGSSRVHHVHNGNRVLAFHRWLEDGGDVIVVASLNDATLLDYRIGFPVAGEWREVFNSAAYDGDPAGNMGRVVADGQPLHGFEASAAIVIPANSVVVFGR